MCFERRGELPYSTYLSCMLTLHMRPVVTSDGRPVRPLSSRLQIVQDPPHFLCYSSYLLYDARVIALLRNQLQTIYNGALSPHVPTITRTDSRTPEALITNRILDTEVNFAPFYSRCVLLCVCPLKGDGTANLACYYV